MPLPCIWKMTILFYRHARKLTWERFIQIICYRYMKIMTFFFLDKGKHINHRKCPKLLLVSLFFVYRFLFLQWCLVVLSPGIKEHRFIHYKPCSIFTEKISLWSHWEVHKEKKVRRIEPGGKIVFLFMYL